MDATLEQYVHLAVSVIVATAVLVMIAACLHLRRDAQVMMANRQFYEEQYNYKSKLNGIVDGDVSVIEAISIVTEYADDIDIYIDRLSGTFATKSLLVNNSNRYLIEELNLSDAMLNTHFNWATVTSNVKTEAKQYGPITAAVVGKVIYGTDKWNLTVVYDGLDVTQVPPATNGDGVNPKITGIRLIKK